MREEVNVADGEHGPERPPTPPSFSNYEPGSLAERLGATRAGQEEEPPPPKGPSLLPRIAYWSATGLGILGALTLLLAAGLISAQHQARLQEEAQPGFDAQGRTTTAQQSLEDLPGRDEADRWLSQATSVGERVAEAQNTFLEHSGPLPLDELPEQTPDAGERDECVSYLEEVPTTPRDYTDEELTACAEGLREEAIGGLERSLTPHFAAQVRDPDGFDAVTQWHTWVSTVEEDVSLADHTWTAHEALVFERDSSIPLVWTLTEDESGRAVAWMRGTFDPLSKKFDQMAFGTVGVDDGEEGADEAEAEGDSETEGDPDEDTRDSGADVPTDEDGHEGEGERG
ncbi:hypothetical protein [Nocardiopsis prasina]|uniref:hypothetical protein n=1 Tax=Nocardiopsis prasina TaxID=2015 RepID=UPI000360F728|nr:hypothetical protein [Nocardiopsis prasina]